MSKKNAKDKYGVDLDFLDIFRFGIILGAIGIMFWAFVNILDVWYDHNGNGRAKA